MNPDPQKAEELFDRALQFKPEERPVFLAGACGNDVNLRKRVEDLLMASETRGGFLPQESTPEAVATLLDETPLTEGKGTVVGRYKLLEKLGEGGFGAVWAAEQREPVKRRVALKIIKLGMDTKQVVARFEAERQALALMDHPNIARVLDAGATETGRPYFVMELVKGIPITKYCDQEKLDTRVRLDLFIKVCQAIQHAHQKGIIHRDIKPSNIMVTLHDGVPVPKVIDFGIAKATQQELTEKTIYTQYSQFIGTPAYMSPEQAEMSGLDIDTRSDIYSLGVLLYELLTGKTPFDANELMSQGIDAMRKTIREKEPVRPSTKLATLKGEELTTTAKSHGVDAPKLASQLRGDLDWIVMKCLEKDRTRRYDTANGLAMDLKRHQTNEPVLARPPSKLYEFQKTFRRHKFGFAATAAVILVLAVGVALTTWQAVQASRARSRESEARQLAVQAARVAESEKERAAKGEEQAKQNEFLARRNLYAADMSLAYQAWQNNNLGRALQLLNRHRPTPPEPDLRGWEWRYLWGLCRSEALYTLGQHSNIVQGVFAVAISPDDRYLATADTYGRGEVRLWDIEARRTVEVLTTNDSLPSVAFSPDGDTLAFATPGQVRLWDLRAHRELAPLPAETTGQYSPPTVAFSPLGGKLATGGPDGKIVIWDLATHAPSTTLDAAAGEIRGLIFSPDGREIITAHRGDISIRVWSLETGRTLTTLTKRGDVLYFVRSIALSPDGKVLASGDEGGNIHIWDLTQRRHVAMLTNHTRWVSALAFSPDGRTLASASADCFIKLWDTRNWEEVSTLRGSLDEVYGIAFSHDGKRLFSGSKDGKIRVWDGTPRPRENKVLRCPEDSPEFGLTSAAIPYCFHTNKTVSLWDPLSFALSLEEPSERNDVLKSERASSDAGFLSPKGDRLAYVTKDGVLHIWDLKREREIASAPCPADTWNLQFSPDEKILVTVTAGKGLTIWNAGSLELVATLPKSGALSGFAQPTFSADGRKVAVGNDDGTVEVWNLERKERAAVWKAHRYGVTGVAFMPDGRHLVTVSGDSTAAIWDLEDQHQVAELGKALNAYFSVAVTADGERIAAGTYDGLVRIWDSTTYQELVTLEGVNDWVGPDYRGNALPMVVGLAFLPQDENVLISNTFAEIRQWRAPSWEEIAAAEAREKIENNRP